MRRFVITITLWLLAGATPNMTTIFQETWPVLKTNSGISGGGLVTMTPHGATARDSDYPLVGETDSIKIVSSGGRNVLSANSSWLAAGVAWDRLGSVVAAGPKYTRWFDAQGPVTYYADYHITTAALAASTFFPVIQLHITLGSKPLRLSIATYDSPTMHVDLFAQQWNTSNINTDATTFAKALIENKRIRFKIVATCGTVLTVDGLGGTDTMGDDGSLVVSMIDLDTNVETVLYTYTGISLYYSYKAQALGGGELVPGNNYLSGASVGYEGLIGENEQFVIEVPDVVTPPVMPEPGSQVDNSTPCCDATGGGSATGPVIPPVTPFWYRRCTGGGVVPTAADVVEPEDWANEFPPKEPNTWLTIVGQAGSPENEADERWGLKPLSDRGRFVAGRLEEVSSIERRSSDKDGNYPPARMRVVALDDDGTFRVRLGDPTRRDLVHREARYELSSYAGRKAGLDPMPRMQGRIVDVQPGLDRKAIVELQDIVGSQFGPLDPQKTIGLEVGDEHPNKPESSKGRIYNILLGEKSDRGATDGNGASASVGMLPVVDCGDSFLPGETPDPEGRLFNDALTVVDDKADVNLTGTGGTITYPTRVFVAPIIGGEIGPFSNVPTGFLDDNGDGLGGPSVEHAHRAVWMDIAGGADEYLAVFTKVPGFHPQTNPAADLNARYQIVSGTPSMPAFPPRNGGVGPQWDFFADFLNDSDGSQWGVLSISAPLNLNYTITGTPGTTRYVYAVSALATLGESPRSAVLVVEDGPAVLNGTDNIVLTWDPPADHAAAVIGYRVRGRQTNPPTTYLRITDIGVSPIPLTYTDDGTDAEKAFNVSSGDALVSENVWAWIACALGEVDIHEVYGSDGAEGDTPKRRLIGWDEGTILGPDSTGWPEAERYRVVGGIRQSGFYARGLPLKHHRDGAVTFAWNGCGWKDPDGVVVDQAFLELLLFLNEVVEKNNGEGYRDGEFGPIEVFADGTPKFWTSKFEAAQQQTIDWLTPGSPAGLGYVGTIVVTEPTPLSEVLRRFFNDYGGHGTTNHRGQWYPFLPNPEPEVGAGRLYRERMEIARLVEHRLAKDEQENRVVYSYDYNFDTQAFRNQNVTVEDAASIAAHGGARLGLFQAGVRECFYANDQTTIEDRWHRHLALYAYPPRYVTWATNLKSLADHNGDPARFSHRKEGLGLNGETGTPGVILHTVESTQPYEVIQTAMLFRT